MATWAYRATDDKAGFEFTRDLAVRHHFLARTAYYPPTANTPRLRKAANAWSVRVGDVLHIYFGGRDPRPIGSFTIDDPAKSGPAFRLARTKAETAFAEVWDPTLIGLLDASGSYDKDPGFKRYVGWALSPVEVEAPEFEMVEWGDRETLTRL